MGEPMSEKTVGQLKVDAAPRGDTFALSMSGTAELKDSTALADLLLEADSAVRSLGLKQVEVDVRAVEFMNSSALNAFVRWFAGMKDRGGGYQVRFLSDPTKRWQRG